MGKVTWVTVPLHNALQRPKRHTTPYTHCNALQRPTVLPQDNPQRPTRTTTPYTLHALQPQRYTLTGYTHHRQQTQATLHALHALHAPTLTSGNQTRYTLTTTPPSATQRTTRHTTHCNAPRATTHQLKTTDKKKALLGDTLQGANQPCF